MCVCVCVIVCVCARLCVFVRARVCVCAYMYACIIYLHSGLVGCDVKLISLYTHIMCMYLLLVTCI